MKLIPRNNYVLCEKIQDTKYTIDELIHYEKKEVPIYKIIDTGKFLDDFRYNVNDQIICNSTGTEVRLDNDFYYLFNIENIIGKIQ